MSNAHYFGAYLEIKVNQIELKEHFYGCEKGHRQNERVGQFCGKCGSPTAWQSGVVFEYPWDISDILGDDWVDELAIITPANMFKTGVILARGNRVNRPDGEWFYLDRFGSNVNTKEFPTEQEIAQMKTDLQTGYAAIIAALKESEIVTSIEIKAGYVLEEEEYL